MNKNILIAIIVGLIGVGGGFLAGVKYQESKTPAFLRQGNGQGRFAQIQGRAGGASFRPVSGEIISSDDKSITVKLQDGSSKIVIIDEKTQINKASEGKKEDLNVGENVAVFGQENSDGSVTAQNIQLNPTRQGFMPQ